MADILGLTPPKASVRMGGEDGPISTRSPLASSSLNPLLATTCGRAHLDKLGGPGIHHLAVRVESLQEDIEYAQRHGGQVVVPPTNGRAVVDGKSHPIPFAVELVER